MKLPVFRCAGHYFFAERVGDGYVVSVPSLPNLKKVYASSMDNAFYSLRCQIDSSEKFAPGWEWEQNPTQQDLLIAFLMVRNGLQLAFNCFDKPLYQISKSQLLSEVLKHEPQLVDNMESVLARAKMPEAPALLAKFCNQDIFDPAVAETYRNAFELDTDRPADLSKLSLTDSELFFLFACLDRSISYVEQDGLFCVKYGKWVFHTGWSKVAQLCRGRVYERDTLKLVSLPFDKFFNLNEQPGYSEPEIRDRLNNSKVTTELSEKKDGTLIIASSHNGTLLATTGKSFGNQYLDYARKMMKFTAADLKDGYTYLFELIHPDTRIVVDYGDERNLYLLAVRQNATGAYLRDLEDIARSLHVPLPQRLSWARKTRSDKLSETLAELKQTGSNKEGWVLTISQPAAPDFFVKLKYHEYFVLSQEKEGNLQKLVFHEMFFGDISKYLAEEETATEAILRQKELIDAALGEYVTRLRTEARKISMEIIGDPMLNFSELMAQEWSRLNIQEAVRKRPEALRLYLLTALRLGDQLDISIFKYGFTWEKWLKIRDYVNK